MRTHDGHGTSSAPHASLRVQTLHRTRSELLRLSHADGELFCGLDLSARFVNSGSVRPRQHLDRATQRRRYATSVPQSLALLCEWQTPPQTYTSSSRTKPIFHFGDDAEPDSALALASETPFASGDSHTRTASAHAEYMHPAQTSQPLLRHCRQIDTAASPPQQQPPQTPPSALQDDIWLPQSADAQPDLKTPSSASLLQTSVAHPLAESDMQLRRDVNSSLAAVASALETLTPLVRTTLTLHSRPDERTDGHGAAGSSRADSCMTDPAQNGSEDSELHGSSTAASVPTRTRTTSHERRQAADDNNDAHALESPICRFCLDDETAGPLASPCRCDGSAKHVHIDCLQRWRKLASNPYNRIRCEICHAYYRLKYPMSGFISIASARVCCWIGYMAYSLIMLYVFRWIFGFLGMRIDGLSWIPESTQSFSETMFVPDTIIAVVGLTASPIQSLAYAQSQIVQLLSPIGPCIMLVGAYPTPSGQDGHEDGLHGPRPDANRHDHNGNPQAAGHRPVFPLQEAHPSPAMITRHIEAFIWWAIVSSLSSTRISFICIAADALYIYCTVIGCVLVALKSMVWSEIMAPKLLVLIADVNGNEIAF